MFQQNRRGDASPPPFEEIVKMYSERVFKLIYARVRDYHDAMDLTQEVFYRAYRGYSRFRGEAQPYTWLYRIAINTTNRFLEKRGRLNEQELPQQVPFEDDPQCILEREETEKNMRKLIERLPNMHRTILYLRYYEGLDYSDIAKVLDIPMGTVRSRLSRARKALEKLLEEQKWNAQG